MTEKKDRRRPKGEKVVSESKALAETIIKALERGIALQYSRKQRIGEPRLIDHVEAMQRALAVSKEKFLRYVHDHIPGIYRDMESILDSKGEEVLLLSLRVIESGHRAYPPQ